MLPVCKIDTGNRGNRLKDLNSCFINSKESRECVFIRHNSELEQSLQKLCQNFLVSLNKEESRIF